MRLRLVIVTLIVLSAAGCVRRDGRNSDCRWPGETSNQPVSARHLSEDAEFAEDLAIRYADVHFGRRTPNASEDYGLERDRCMERLFAEIGKEHGIPVSQVSASLGQNRAYIDMAELLPFALAYVLAAVIVARMVWRRYLPDDDNWTPGIVMALFVSLAVAVGSNMLGEMWNWILETHRIGNNHISYRANRLFCAKHRLELFVIAIVIFWLAAIAEARRMHSGRLNGH